MKHKLTFGLSFFVFVAAMFLMTSFKTAYASVTWCDVLAPNNDNSANNCLNGVTENALNGVNTKAEIINALNRFNSYGGYQRIGAQYIMCGLEGKGQGCSPGNDWETRINNPAVSVRVVGGYGTCTNSAYDPGARAVVTYPECGSFPAFLFEYNGVVKYAIKTDCGNPLGVLAGLPPYNPDTPPTGSIRLSCNSDGTGKVSFSFNDDDGNTTARLTINFAGGGPNGVYNYSGNGSRVGGVSAVHADGNWSATLLVQDNGGNQDRSYSDSSGTCNDAPVGSLGIRSCKATSVKLWDPNTPNSNIRYYLTLNGGALHGPFIFGGKDASAVAVDVSSYAGFSYWDGNTVRLYGVDTTNGARTGVLDTATLPSCGTVACNASMIAIQGTVAAGEPIQFRVWVSVTGAAGGPPGASFTSISISGPKNYGPVTSPYSGAPKLLSDWKSFTFGGAGSYVFKWTFGGGKSNPNSISCQKTIKAGYDPYFNVLGGDIAAGSGFGNSDSCDETTPAGIVGWNLGTPSFVGAGSEMGAWATDDLSNFVTGMGLSGGAASQSGYGLSFANGGSGVDTSPPAYGGTFGEGMINCTPDYYSTLPAGAPTLPSNIVNASFAGLSGAYNAIPAPPDNDVRIGNPAHNPIQIPSNGEAITLYVNGDVYIDSNITYAPYSLSSVPRFNLYVKGNIYIDPNVTEIHGLYVAQGSGSNGNITTCQAGPAQSTQTYQDCDKQFKVVGAMAAENQILMSRTHGNLKAVSDPSVPGGVKQEPAEIFQYSPELWLNAPSSPGSKVRSFTSLPPVL